MHRSTINSVEASIEKQATRNTRAIRNVEPYIDCSPSSQDYEQVSVRLSMPCGSASCCSNCRVKQKHTHTSTHSLIHCGVVVFSTREGFKTVLHIPLVVDDITTSMFDADDAIAAAGEPNGPIQQHACNCYQ
jgi:hypothetical protein